MWDVECGIGRTECWASSCFVDAHAAGLCLASVGNRGCVVCTHNLQRTRSHDVLQLRINCRDVAPMLLGYQISMVMMVGMVMMGMMMMLISMVMMMMMMMMMVMMMMMR